MHTYMCIWIHTQNHLQFQSEKRDTEIHSWTLVEESTWKLTVHRNETAAVHGMNFSAYKVSFITKAKCLPIEIIKNSWPLKIDLVFCQTDIFTFPKEFCKIPSSRNGEGIAVFHLVLWRAVTISQTHLFPKPTLLQFVFPVIEMLTHFFKHIYMCTCMCKCVHVYGDARCAAELMLMKTRLFSATWSLKYTVIDRY